MVVVPRRIGGVRITVDLSKLEKLVLRPAHPLPTQRDAIMKVTKSSTSFINMDAMYVYWQDEVAEELQPLTTFITSWRLHLYGR